ncbi:flagellar hook-length control protein FliK [Cupriavidus basilensis]|uniref:flagellar hook-length control protein FliK n=1 Tax=Cupriavidus basilensis TaxID=68895 RepID=UPI00157A8576|nr:flagellar hook-length control protein FliK [Cupriavidus basilensis]
MIGINLPADASLALRTDPQALKSALTVAKLAALQPVGTVTDMVGPAEGGNTVQQGRAGTVGAGMPPTPEGAATTSARESLSTAARVILDILDGTDAAPLRSAAPIVATPPGSGQAASLASALARQVGQSGLFYESHLGQWLNGTRPLDSLMREPQAMLGRPPAAPATTDATQPVLQLTYQPAAGAAAPAPAQAAAQAAADAAKATAAVVVAAESGSLPLPAEGPGADTPAQAQKAASTYSAPAPSAASTAAAPAANPSTPSAHLAQQATQAYQAASATPAPRLPHLTADDIFGASKPAADPLQAASASATGPAVHPDATTLVRQQLDTLATQQLRWMGEAWPGTPMQWQITREQDDNPARAQGEPDAIAGGTWSTRLVLEFPNLGTVEARLRLTGNSIEAHLAAPASVNVLAGARAQLQERLAATGLDLTALAVDGIFQPAGSTRR